MELQESIEIVAEYQRRFKKMSISTPNNKLDIALDTLIAHAKQPVQVTDEMVCALQTALRYNVSQPTLKAALQTALGVK